MGSLLINVTNCQLVTKHICVCYITGSGYRDALTQIYDLSPVHDNNTNSKVFM